MTCPFGGEGLDGHGPQTIAVVAEGLIHRCHGVMRRASGSGAGGIGEIPESPLILKTPTPLRQWRSSLVHATSEHPADGGTRRDAELGEDSRQVALHGAVAQEELGGDLAVGLAFGNERGDLSSRRLNRKLPAPLRRRILVSSGASMTNHSRCSPIGQEDSTVCSRSGLSMPFDAAKATVVVGRLMAVFEQVHGHRPTMRRGNRNTGIVQIPEPPPEFCPVAERGQGELGVSSRG